MGCADLIVSYADIVREREATLSEQPVPKVDALGRVGAHRPEGVATKVARDLGITKQTVNRALARSRAPASVEPRHQYRGIVPRNARFTPANPPPSCL